VVGGILHRFNSLSVSFPRRKRLELEFRDILVSSTRRTSRLPLSLALPSYVRHPPSFSFSTYYLYHFQHRISRLSRPKNWPHVRLVRRRSPFRLLAPRFPPRSSLSLFIILPTTMASIFFAPPPKANRPVFSSLSPLQQLQTRTVRSFSVPPFRFSPPGRAHTCLSSFVCVQSCSCEFSQPNSSWKSWIKQRTIRLRFLLERRG